MLRRFFLPALLYLIASLLLIRIPLFNYLGYEFSTAVALFAPLICGYGTIRIFREHIALEAESNSKRVFQTYWLALRINLFQLIIPLLIVTVNLLFVKNCSYMEGVVFFLLIPVVTCIWSVSLASFSATASNRPHRLYCFLIAIVLFHPLYIGYTTPQIYSYNFIYGYFPGFSHDEVLSITPTLVMFRLFTLVVAVFLFLITTEMREYPRHHSLAKNIFTFFIKIRLSGRYLFSRLLFLGILLFYVFRTQLGLETSTLKLQHELSEQYSTEHFHIFYAPNSFPDEELVLIGVEHEFRFQQVKEALRTHFNGTIDSYIYPDAETKLRLIGTGVTNIAKPWRKEIHLNKDAWQATLKHELVHVLAGEFGMPIIKAHYNMGLVEGLATAVDGDWGNRTLHEYAAAMKTFHVIESPKRLISSVGFAFQYPSLSYVMMGSFCKFLIDKYGIVRFKELYRGKSPEVIYEKSYSELASEWQTMLSRIKVPDEWRGHTEFYFKRPSIFAKECARAIAKLNQRGWKLLAENQPDTSQKVFSLALHKSWNSESFVGLVRSYYKEMRFDSVRLLLNEKLKDSVHRGSFLHLLLLYGDALWSKGDIPLAQTIYNEILALNLSEQYDEAVTLRLTALSNNSMSQPMLHFFTASIEDSAALLLLDSVQKYSPSPLLSYLTSRTFFRLKRYTEAVVSLEHLHKSFDAPILNAQKERLLAQSYFQLHQFQKAKIHYWQSLNFITNQSSIERVNDWIERCDWDEEYTTRLSRK